MIKKFFITIIFINSLFALPAQAYQSVLEPANSEALREQGLYFGSIRLDDPTETSLTVYGTQDKPDAYDIYVFVPGKDATIPVQILIPIHARNANFKPSVYIIARDIADPSDVKPPLEIPSDYKIREIRIGERRTQYFEPFSLERSDTGTEYALDVKKGKNYFIVVSDPNHQAGDYALTLGTKNEYGQTTSKNVISNIFQIKSGLIGATSIPWLDMLGLFTMLMGIVLGLGGVIAINVPKILARRSEHLDTIVTKTYSIIKPFILVGLIIMIAGGIILYRQNWLNGVVLFQCLLTLFIIKGEVVLSLLINPKIARYKLEKPDSVLPRSIRFLKSTSALVIFFGWVGNLVLLVWYLFMQR